MKLPWPASSASSEETSTNTSNNSMDETTENYVGPEFDFEGKRYDFNSLKEESKKLVHGLRVADTQIRMYRNTLRVLEVGRQTMSAQLQENLKEVKPIS